MLRPLALFSLAALLAGCPRPLDFGPQGRIDDPGELLRRVDAQGERLRSVTGDAKLGLRGPEGQGEVALFVAVERPAKLRLESFDFFNRPIAALTSDGERFGLYDATQARYYFGPATAQNLQRFLRAPLTPAQVVALMLGDAPRDLNAELRLTLDTEAQAYRVSVLSTPAQLLWIDPLRLRPIRAQWGGAPGLEARFSQLTDTGGFTFAKEIQVEAGEIELRLRYAEVTLNPRDEALFAIEPPEGVPRTELDAEGRPLPPRD